LVASIEKYEATLGTVVLYIWIVLGHIGYNSPQIGLSIELFEAANTGLKEMRLRLRRSKTRPSLFEA